MNSNINFFVAFVSCTIYEKQNRFLFFFVWEFGPGQLTSFHFILMKLDFISLPSSKSTLPFAGLQHMQQCNARLISTRFLLPCFDPNEWCMKNVLHSVGLNPRPLSHESSALNCHEGLYLDKMVFKFESRIINYFIKNFVEFKS